MDDLRTGYHLNPPPRQRSLDPAPGRLVRRRRHRRKTLHRSREERAQHARGPHRSCPVLHGSHLLVLHLVGQLCRGLQRVHAGEHAAVVDLRCHIRGHLLAVGSRAEPGSGAIYRYYCRGSRVEVRVSGSRRGRALEGGAGACWWVPKNNIPSSYSFALHTQNFGPWAFRIPRIALVTFGSDRRRDSRLLCGRILQRHTADLPQRHRLLDCNPHLSSSDRARLLPPRLGGLYQKQLVLTLGDDTG